MKAKPGVRRLCIFAVTAALTSTACGPLWRNIFVEEPPLPDIPRGAVKLSGDLVSAASVGLEDLLAQRREARDQAIARWSGGDAGDPSEDAGIGEQPDQADGGIPDSRRWFVECFARPESYDSYVAWTGDRYVVRIIPIKERCFDGGGSLHGGAARYELGPDFKILRAEFDE